MSWLRKGSCSSAKSVSDEAGDELIVRHLASPESEAIENAHPPANQTPVRTPEPTASYPALLYGYSSERGARRRNEDYCAASEDGVFFAISDGIGGGPHGDVMSRLAVSCAIEAHKNGLSTKEAFARADALASEVSRLLDEGDGATLLLAAYDYAAARFELLSAGDTLAFRLRNNELSLLSGGDGRACSNALEKAVGWGKAKPDRTLVEVRAGDRILLCTDGVWEPLGENKIARILEEETNAPWAAARMCEEAIEAGTDNATAICIFVEGCRNADRNLWSTD